MYLSEELLSDYRLVDVKDHVHFGIDVIFEDINRDAYLRDYFASVIAEPSLERD